MSLATSAMLTLSQAYQSFYRTNGASYNFTEKKIKVGFCRFILMQMVENGVKNGYWAVNGRYVDCDELMLKDEAGFFYRGLVIEGVHFEINVVMYPEFLSGSQWEDFAMNFQIYQAEGLDVTGPVEVEIAQKSSASAHLLPVILMFKSVTEKAITR